MGIQIGYVTGAKFAFFPKFSTKIAASIKKTFELMENLDTDLQDIIEQDKINRMQAGILAGFDYEFEIGLILGLAWSKDFTIVLESKDSQGNLTFRPTLGYNLGKLLK